MSTGIIPETRKRQHPDMQAKESLERPTDHSPAKYKKLLSWHEISAWQQDNEYILSGYRPASGSLHRSLQSLRHIHNETVNIYSHLLGAALFFTLPFYIYNKLHPRYPSAQQGDIVVFSTFFFGVAICFLLSSFFHVMANHSESVAARWNQLDYVGVVILMWGSTIPSVYYGFYCDPGLQKLYWSVVTVLAAACIYATLNPSFRRPHLRAYRAAMYAGLGLSAIIFIIHGLLIHGWETQKRRMSLVWMALMGTFNLIGAATYAARVPERWYPRQYDIFGSSHQILHVMVILAGLTHMIGLLEAFDFLHVQASPCGQGLRTG